MNDDQDSHNLMSEKQAAARLGISRITLLRAREAGRIRFFRIGTRVLYSENQVVEFLNSCEQNARVEDRSGTVLAAKRKDNQVSPAGKHHAHDSARSGKPTLKKEEVDQVLLPFSAAN